MIRQLPALGALLLIALPAQSHAQDPSNQGQTRTDYLAADEVEWDYLPGGRDMIAGRAYVDSAFFADAEPRPVSTVYKKALFRE